MGFDAENSTSGKNAHNTITLSNLTAGADFGVSFSDGTTVLAMNKINAGGFLEAVYAGTPVGQHLVASVSNAQAISDFEIGAFQNGNIVVNNVTAESAGVSAGSGTGSAGQSHLNPA